MIILSSIFTNYTFWIVSFGCMILGLTSGVIGSFALVRKQTLLGDGVSHAALPGVVLAFLLIGTKNMEFLLRSVYCQKDS